MPSLKFFYLYNFCEIDKIKLLDQSKSLELLYLTGNFSYFSLDSLLNLKELVILGTINKYFNLDIFKNICNRLQRLTVSFNNIDDETFYKLFDGHHFSNLSELRFIQCDMGTISHSFIDRFPMLRELYIEQCDLVTIEHDCFKSLKNLNKIDIRQNLIKSIGNNAFANNINLETVNLCDNEIELFDTQFTGLYPVKIVVETH